MGRRRKGRPVNGIVLLDKALGGSSNHVLQQVKHIYFAEKAGHTGALDPLATGMLPICLGEATKFSQFLLDADKVYEVTAKLGIRTTTSDADGEVVETKPVNVSAEQLVQACEGFKGDSKQIPSMFSALKHQGKPLYHYARQGIEIEREARDITIFALDILRFEDDEVDMRVHCSKGTYIRSLVDDLGQLLGCGAYVTRLHRTHVANYPNDKMVTVEQLEALLEQARNDGVEPKTLLDSILLPMDTAVGNLPEYRVADNFAGPFSNGNAIPCDLVLDNVGQQYRCYDQLDAAEGPRFIGVAELLADGKLQPKRLVVYTD